MPDFLFYKYKNIENNHHFKPWNMQKYTPIILLSNCFVCQILYFRFGEISFVYPFPGICSAFLKNAWIESFLIDKRQWAVYYRVQQFYNVLTVANVIKKDFIELLLSNYVSSGPTKCLQSSGTYPEKAAKQ